MWLKTGLVGGQLRVKLHSIDSETGRRFYTLLAKLLQEKGVDSLENICFFVRRVIKSKQLGQTILFCRRYECFSPDC